MKEYDQTGLASIAGFTASVVFVIIIAGSLTWVSNAVARNPDNQSYANVEKCKAFYQELKAEELNNLNRRKQMMGPGMPDTIYGRKKRKIGTEYESNLASCESQVTSRGR